ncbi:MAG: hypothetical protein KC583_20885, partial [Myxococcales bacterium]|nr:hypothetical protein [Myxococcales bacterium]
GYPGGGGHGMTPRLLSGSGRVELGGATWFARLDVRQHVELLNQGKRAFDTRAQRRYVEAVPREGVFDDQPMNLSEYIWGPVPEDVLAQAHREGRFAWLRGVPHDEAWKHYVALRDGGAPGAFFEAQALMRAWMAMNPEGVKALAQAMRDGAFDESAQSQIVLAMAKSGSPVAAAALRAMALDGALGENLRVQATSALADLRAPTADTVDALTRLASRGEGVSEHDLVGSTATMALGSLMRDHPGYAPVAEPARAYLEQVLTEDDPVRLAEGLYAVGNAADEVFLPQIHALAGHVEPNVRAAAAHATRRMSREATAGLLGDLLREDPAPVVVEEIAMAHQEQLALTKGRLTGREISLYRTKLPSAPLKTRIEVVRTLGAVAPIQPEAQGVLAWWFHHETEAQVREMIGRFVPVDQLAVR